MSSNNRNRRFGRSEFKPSDLSKDVQDIADIHSEVKFINWFFKGVCCLCASSMITTGVLSYIESKKANELEREREKVVDTATLTQEYIEAKKIYEENLFLKYNSGEIDFDTMTNQIKEYSSNEEITRSFLGEEESKKVEELDSEIAEHDNKSAGWFLGLFGSGLATCITGVLAQNPGKKNNEYYETDVDYPHY